MDLNFIRELFKIILDCFFFYENKFYLIVKNCYLVFLVELIWYVRIMLYCEEM